MILTIKSLYFLMFFLEETTLVILLHAMLCRTSITFYQYSEFNIHFDSQSCTENHFKLYFSRNVDLSWYFGGQNWGLCNFYEGLNDDRFAVAKSNYFFKVGFRETTEKHFIRFLIDFSNCLKIVIDLLCWQYFFGIRRLGRNIWHTCTFFLQFTLDK